MKTTPTYKPGQPIALRFRAIGDSAPGIYTLQRADGTTHAAEPLAVNWADLETFEHDHGAQQLLLGS